MGDRDSLSAKAGTKSSHFWSFSSKVVTNQSVISWICCIAKEKNKKNQVASYRIRCDLEIILFSRGVPMEDVVFLFPCELCAKDARASWLLQLGVGHRIVACIIRMWRPKLVRFRNRTCYRQETQIDSQKILCMTLTKFRLECPDLVLSLALRE